MFLGLPTLGASLCQTSERLVCSPRKLLDHSRTYNPTVPSLEVGSLYSCMAERFPRFGASLGFRQVEQAVCNMKRFAKRMPQEPGGSDGHRRRQISTRSQPFTLYSCPNSTYPAGSRMYSYDLGPSNSGHRKSNCVACSSCLQLRVDESVKP